MWVGSLTEKIWQRIPPETVSTAYLSTLSQLIDNVDGDTLVPISGRALYHRWIKLQDENNMQHITFHDLRHLNTSGMALLRIPDKYAQERGGWKSDQVMKNVYINTFSEEREAVDNIIDDFFGSIADPASEDVDGNKYRAWLTLFEREDNIESIKEFLAFMQHEIQHNKKSLVFTKLLQSARRDSNFIAFSPSGQNEKCLQHFGEHKRLKPLVNQGNFSH